MPDITKRAGEIRSAVSSKVDEASVSVEDGLVEVDVRKSTVEARGEVESDLSEIKAAVKKEIEDVLGYDVDVTVLVNMNKR